MSRFDFKGDIETIGQPQLAFIGKVLEERGFIGSDVFFESVGGAGDNYAASVKRVVIKENGKTFKMIAKLAPNSPIMREMANISIIFNNEHVMYSELFPKFRELQKDAGVPKENWFRYAEFYGSNSEAPNEVILLEDLREDNYVMMDRFKALSNDCVKIVFKNLAIYHSLSFVLSNQEPEIFAGYKSTLKNFVLEIGDRDEFQYYLKRLEDQALAVLQDDKYKKVVKGIISQSITLNKEIEKQIDLKYSVIQHGDGWTNNILFQMEGETPKSCLLIDYQMSRISSPVYDLMYTLFNSTSHEQRQKHYYEFMDHYISEMDSALKYFGLRVDNVYPRDRLDADLKLYANFMLATSVMLSTFVIRKTEEASKFKDAMENTKVEDVEKAVDTMLAQDQETLVLFKKRIEEQIDSFLEFGLLQE